VPKNERAKEISIALTRAKKVLNLYVSEPVCKGIWGSPMGKTLLAKRIVAEIPDHKIYVEPFAGGAQVFFAKEPSQVEVINDLDPEIAFAFKFAKNITADQIKALRTKKWVGDREHFRKLMKAEVPNDGLERFYRFAYLSRFSFNKLRRGTMPNKNVGERSRFVERLERFAPRLKHIKARNTDYERIIEEYDGPDTFFFLDPPYAGYDADVRSGSGHREWDEERFAKVIQKIRGRFLCTYGTRGNTAIFDRFHIRRWRHTSGVGASQGRGPKIATSIVATNYDPDRVKRFQVAVSKTIWGSPAGKKRLSERLSAMLPAHKTYVEPFAGSAAVLFAKESADVEVLCDADVEIAKAYRIIKRLSREQISKLRAMKWTGDKATFKRLINETPKGDVESLYRFLYLTHFSYGKLRGKSFSPSGEGVESRTVDRVEAFSPRLKNVRIYDGDYLKVVKKYDSPNTVFFFDPPYTGHNVDVGESDFDEERFFEVLKSLKGKFLLTYGIRGKLPQLLKSSRFNVQRIRTRRTIRSMRGVGGPTMLTQLVVTNYKPIEKELPGHDEWIVEDWRDATDIQEIEKVQPFGTFGGSHHYAKRIVPLIPEHTTYVEPFAGAAALLHVKEPSDKEVIADMDEDLVFMHRFIKGMTGAKLDKLKTFDWTCTKASWKRVREMTPKDDVERFYKLAFIRGKGRDARPDATHPAGSAMGQSTNPEKYLNAAERLKKVAIYRQDYHKTIAANDGSDTFFFIDPPYPGEWYDKNAVINLDDFIDTIKSIKGRFIAVLNDSPENVTAFKKVGHIFRLKVQEASGTGGAKKASRLFCANFRIQKADGVEDISIPKNDGISDTLFSKEIPLIKGLDKDDERFVLGIVLAPDEVDAQGDIYSAKEINQAAHRFMEEFGGLGLMHRFRVNDRVKVLESYLAPCDFELADTQVTKGTWLLAVRILSDKLWEQDKEGKLTGFSIGGSARRVAEPSSPNEEQEAAA
jgi:DNA adenine methylase